MSFDLPAHLAGMSRAVTFGERDGQRTTTAVLSRVFATDADDLWDAVTSPERLARWFLPISGDLRLGGRYQLEGNAGGTIGACDPPRRIEATWEYGGGVSWVVVQLTPEQRGTRLELQHIAHVMDEYWPIFGPGAVGVGWDAGFLGLARHLADPEAFSLPPEKDPAWMAEESKAFYRAASDAWGGASIEAGTPEAEAIAAAERTRAFYSGESGPPVEPEADQG